MTLLAIAVLAIGYMVLGCVALLIGQIASFDTELSPDWKMALFFGWPFFLIFILVIRLWPLLALSLAGGCVWAVLYLAGVF